MRNKYPFAVRLLGFDADSSESIAAAFAPDRKNGYGYVYLHEDNLQDPDFYIANAEDINALAKLPYLCPGDIRPALLIGQPPVDTPHPWLPTPFTWPQLLAALDVLVERRADALVALQASGVVKVPERRRSARLDIDFTDPTEYERMRRPMRSGDVLVIDKTAMMRDFLAGVLSRQQITVALAHNAIAAHAYCAAHPVALALINTSTPGIEPYALCRKIKHSQRVQAPAVVLLTGKAFVYDASRAHEAGADGFLTKPLAAHHLLLAVKKFLPQSHRRDDGQE